MIISSQIGVHDAHIEAQQPARHRPGPGPAAGSGHEADESEGPGKQVAAADRGTAVGAREALSIADLRQVQALRATDAKVRSHEQAHIAAGGSLVRGGATYEFTNGPDGRRYAVAGEVDIDTGTVPGDPGRTLERAQQVRRAALAPANPSAQDRAVAAQAAATINEARSELAAMAREQGREESGASANASELEDVAPSGTFKDKEIAAYEAVAHAGAELAPEPLSVQA